MVPSKAKVFNVRIKNAITSMDLFCFVMCVFFFSKRVLCVWMAEITALMASVT